MTIPLVASPYRIYISELADLEKLSVEWRLLEAAADCSFFQGWTWVGCLAEHRFTRPVLLEARRTDGRPAALALLNRTGKLRVRLHLGESGNRGLDAPFVEHNGPLMGRDVAGLLPRCVETLLTHPLQHAGRWLPRRLVLSGVDTAHLAAAQLAGRVIRLRTRTAPFVDLAALGPGDDAYLASLSANTRYQLRRSIRRYEEAGAITVHRARSVAEALTFLDELARLHQKTWSARGMPGAFATPTFVHFHRVLIARGMPRNEVDVLRISAGDLVLGYLYNFVYRGRVSSYQAGFNYATADRHRKPGLTSHVAAIAHYIAQGSSIYDFLAGGDRYKLSLANAQTDLHWLEIAARRA